MVNAVPLSTIIALARAGALEHAWYEFRAAGYDLLDDDPAALTVKGRLLKDRAIQARGEERRLFYQESAETYRRSAELQPGTYPLINAATLSLLSGDRDQAREIAGEVLERIALEPEEPETPYWRAATEAEALLLTDRFEEARAKLAAAVEAAPRAWEDHASTLRQFILIHEALDSDPLWLDMLRPPRSLSYSGGGAIDAAGCAEAAAAARDIIARERIGFGFGALAAGADIAVAESLLESGAELHVVLPSDPESFARDWVDPFGAAWRERFDAALAAADTVHLVRPVQVPPGAPMLALAREVSRGAARLNAERLISESRELPLGDGEGAQTSEPPAAGERRTPLLALLSVNVGIASDQGFENRLEEVRQLLENTAGGAIPPHLGGDNVLVGFAEVAAAAAAARAIWARLRGRMPLRIAGHFGFISVVRDPFLGAIRASEAGSAILRAIAQATPPDTVCASLDFAAALAAAGGPGCASWIGELHAFDGGAAIPLYALSAASGD